MQSTLFENESLTSTLDRLWTLRHTGRLDEAYEGFIYLCIKQDLHPRLSLEVRWANGLQCFSPSELIDFFCLEASFCRRRDESEKAIAIFSFLEKKSEAAIHFQLHFQKGLQSLHMSHFTDAKNSFYLARRYARSALEKNFSALNFILCLEALGYDYDAEIVEFLNQMEPYGCEAWAPTLIGVSRAMQLRSCFRGGSTSELSCILQSPEIAGDQATYFMLWLEEIPYFSWHLTAHGRLENLQKRMGSYQGGYRIRTIMGTFLPEDLNSSIRPSDHIQRLYLWTWRWLVKPESSLLGKVLRLRDYILQSVVSGNLTAEDSLMLENSLRWMGLFSGQLDELVKPLATMNADPCARSFPFLDYERRLIDLFYHRSLRNLDFDRDILSVLGDSNLFGNEYCRLSTLLDDGSEVLVLKESSGRLELLKKALKSLSVDATNGSQNFTENHFQIDMRSGAISSNKNGICEFQTVSEQLSVLIRTLLRYDGKAKIQDVVRVCFNSNRYQPDLHDQKLARLLGRAHKTFYPFTFQKRESVIISDLKSNKICFLNDNEHIRQLRENIRGFDYPTVKSNGQGHFNSRSRPVTSDLSGWISRKDLEWATGLAKSSLVRKINHWVSCGQIEKRGRGKSTSYRLGKEFQLHSSYLLQGDKLQ